MALFFDLKTLEEQSANDPEKLIAMLAYHYNKTLNINLQKYR